MAYGLSKAADPFPLRVVGSLLGGGLLLAGTLAYERRTADPLLPPGLLRGRVRSASLLAAALTASTSPAMLLAVLYVQDLLRLSPGRAAWLFPALNLTVIGGSLAGPALIRPAGPRRTAVAGVVLIAAGSLPLTALPPAGLPVLAAFALMGLGLGVASVASTAVGTAAAAGDDQGVTGGVLNSAAQLGTALGLALLAPLALRGDDVLAGLRLGWVGAAGIAALGLVAAVALPRRDVEATDPRRRDRPAPSPAGRRG